MNAHSPIVTDEVARINRALAELMALKSAIKSGKKFDMHMAEYNVCRALIEEFGENLQSVMDFNATRLEREFGWDAAEDRPSRDEPLSTAQVERVFPRSAVS